MCIVHWWFSVCITFDFNDGFFVEWDDNCEGLVRTIAREKEWEKRQALNDAIDWGKKDGSEAPLEEGWPIVPFGLLMMLEIRPVPMVGLASKEGLKWLWKSVPML
jgi:hypothetical protein